MNAPVDDVVARHLLEARTELLQQRVKIDADLQDIERILTNRGVNVREQAGDPVGDPQGFQTTASAPVMSTREAIVMVLNSEDRDFQLSEIIPRVLALGVDAQEGSIRSVMSRVVKEGQAVKGLSGRSSYRAPRPGDAGTGSADTEPVPDVVPDLTASGGDVSSEAQLEGDRDDLAGRNDHHHAGAPITG